MASLLFGVQPTDATTIDRGDCDDHAGRRGRVLAAGLARVATGSERRAERQTSGSWYVVRGAWLRAAVNPELRTADPRTTDDVPTDRRTTYRGR